MICLFSGTTIKDMIQWHPGEYSYWTADNIQNVNSSGLESSVSLDYKINNITSGFNAGYSFTKATSQAGQYATMIFPTETAYVYS